MSVAACAWNPAHDRQGNICRYCGDRDGFLGWIRSWVQPSGRFRAAAYLGLPLAVALSYGAWLEFGSLPNAPGSQLLTGPNGNGLAVVVPWTPETDLVAARDPTYVRGGPWGDQPNVLAAYNSGSVLTVKGRTVVDGVIWLEIVDNKSETAYVKADDVMPIALQRVPTTIPLPREMKIPRLEAVSPPSQGQSPSTQTTSLGAQTSPGTSTTGPGTPLTPSAGRAQSAAAQTAPANPACPGARTWIEGALCEIRGLADKDHVQQRLYYDAWLQAGGRRRLKLKREMYAWVSRRNQCQYSIDPPTCLQQSFDQRIADLKTPPTVTRPVQTTTTEPKQEQEPQPQPITGEPDVATTSALYMNNTLIQLAGVSGSSAYKAKMQEFIDNQGGAVTCTPVGSKYRCVTATGHDIAATALLNGAATATSDASSDYRSLEDQARKAKRGIWADQP